MKIDGLEELIKRIETFETTLPSKCGKITNEVLEFGENLAQDKFSNAIYDGTNDVVVSSTAKKYKNSYVGYVRANGKTVAFIEFGTGVTYMKPEHPKAVRYWAIRGSFGKGLGKKQRWYYKGNPGSQGQVVSSGDWTGYVSTNGNPANRCLYDSAKTMRLKAKTLIRKVSL